MSERPDDIVGHKTFDTGHRDQHGLPIMRHEPLTRAEGEALWAAAEKAKADREMRMPDEKAAIHAFFDAWVRLKDFGWREIMYCPKDDTHFQVLEAGSTGIHDAAYQEEPTRGSFWLYGDGDVCPSHPVMFKLYPADEEKRKERMAEARRKWRELQSAHADGESSSAPAEEQENGAA